MYRNVVEKLTLLSRRVLDELQDEFGKAVVTEEDAEVDPLHPFACVCLPRLILFLSCSRSFRARGGMRASALPLDGGRSSRFGTPSGASSGTLRSRCWSTRRWPRPRRRPTWMWTPAMSSTG